MMQRKYKVQREISIGKISNIYWNCVSAHDKIVVLNNHKLEPERRILWQE